MNNYLNELCPVCIDNPAEYNTECGHKYCIECLCRIKKCALCRKPLLKTNLCIEIKNKNKNIPKYDFLGISSTVRIIANYYNISNDNTLRIISGISGMAGLAGGTN
jgi:hypothetical protein